MSLYGKKILWAEKAYVAFNDSLRSRKLILMYDHGLKKMLKSGELEDIHKKWGQPFHPEYWGK